MTSDVSEKLIDGRRVRWDDERAADAYARGWWVRETLADSLADAALRTPQRVVLIDGDHRLDCHSLHERATALARALLERMTIGSVVSFMLPNWHEAAIIYLGATIAGLVVNPILPSLRESELLFILRDADTRMIFVPSVFGRHDYAAMLTRVVAQMENPPEVVVVRDGAAALDYLFGLHDHEGRDTSVLPQLVLLDLKLPKVDGLAVLRAIRGDERTKRLPVVILTSSKQERDLLDGYELGANSYVRKPVDFTAFAEAVRHLGLYWLVLNESSPAQRVH